MSTMSNVSRRTISVVVLGVSLLCTTALMVGCERTATPAVSAASGGSTYDQVTRSGVIRAAYLTYPPAAMRDPKTGKMSGIFVEALERAAGDLGLKVEWTEEVGWGSQIAGLEAGRYDIIGSPVWANPTRGKLATLSRPLYFSGIGVYARGDNARVRAAFASDWTKLNDPSVRIATIDGETGDVIAKNQFPNAARTALPQNAEISQLFLEVADKKADIFFAEPYFALQYQKNNTTPIVNLAPQRPIKVLGNVYMMRKGEWQLKQALDVELDDLINSGYVDTLLTKYEGGDTFYKVAPPYQPKN